MGRILKQGAPGGGPTTEGRGRWALKEGGGGRLGEVDTEEEGGSGSTTEGRGRWGSTYEEWNFTFKSSQLSRTQF